jgi:succinate dehydrogenase/fumarate reductase-like Fe-S protein
VRPVSFLRLGWHFATRLVARLFRRDRGLLRFRASYGPEGLFELTPEEQEAVSSLSRCIACGLCDAHFGAYERVARGSMRAPSDVMLAETRSLPDWDALEEPLAQLERGDLARMERLCPAHIPLARVVAVAKRRAEALGRAGVGGAAALPREKRHDPG